MKYNQFNKFVDKLEREIIEKEIKDHNKYIVEHFRNPHNWGKPLDENYNYFQECHGEHGEMFQLFLKINKEGIIEETYFLTDGCGCMVATGSQLTLLIKGKSVDNAKNLKPNEIDEALGGLPEHEKHCTTLAILTLNSLITNYKKSF